MVLVVPVAGLKMPVELDIVMVTPLTALPWLVALIVMVDVWPAGIAVGLAVVIRPMSGRP